MKNLIAFLALGLFLGSCDTEADKERYDGLPKIIGEKQKQLDSSPSIPQESKRKDQARELEGINEAKQQHD